MRLDGEDAFEFLGEIQQDCARFPDPKRQTGWSTPRPTSAGIFELGLTSTTSVAETGRFAPPEPPCGTPGDLAALADLLAAAERPVLLMGRGSRRQDDWDRRVALAELTGAPVVTSLRERAVFPTTHAQHVSPPSGWMTPAARRVLETADVVVSLDWVDLDGYLQQLDRQTSRIGAQIVHVSLDSILHNGWSMDHFGLPPADRQVMADPDGFVAQLPPALTERLGRAKPVWSERSPAPEIGFSPNAAAELVPHNIEVALSELQREHVLTLAHATIGWAATNFRFEGPLDYLGHDGGAGLAAGRGLTMGAALALRDSGQIVVGVIGDGDLMQGIAALWTAAHYRIPALFIVSSNRSNFNDEVHQETVAKMHGRPVENRWVGQRIDDPAIDLAAIARAQGVEAVGPVVGLDALRAALVRGLETVRSGRPFLGV